MSARGAIAAALAAAACHAGPSAASAPTAEPASGSSALVAVAIEFEPPLPAPGALVVVHESGLVVSAAARPSGAELLLPPGPATLRLDCGGALHELAIRVAAGMPTVVWAWRGARGTMSR